jgi:transposase
MDDLTSEILVQDIDHLGIVAGIIDQIGLVEEVDRRLGNHSQEHVTCGQVLKGLILNGLGFVSAPLYLFEPVGLTSCRSSLSAKPQNI